VFSTTADAAANPTERLRINSSGQIAVAGAGSAAAPVITKGDDLNTGIFFPAADTIAFAEGGSEAARIDSSGRLLVGTSSSSASIRLAIQGNSASATGTAIAYWQAGSAAASITSGSGIGDIAFTDNAGNRGAQISATADGNWGLNDYPSRLVFFTAAAGSGSLTERMRINQAGIVDVGRNGVGGNIRAMVASGQAMQFSNTNTATTNLTFIEFGRSATTPENYTAEGTIGTDGSGNLAFTNASDATLKENIRDLSGCLATLNALRPVLFDWKPDFKSDCSDVKGFIAQEFEPVLPRSVTTDENGIKSISPVTELLPLLVGAIKELTAEINDLQVRLAALDGN
jgi:hypothetical protein